MVSRTATRQDFQAASERGQRLGPARHLRAGFPRGASRRAIAAAGPCEGVCCPAKRPRNKVRAARCPPRSPWLRVGPDRTQAVNGWHQRLQTRGQWTRGRLALAARCCSKHLARRPLRSHQSPSRLLRRFLAALGQRPQLFWRQYAGEQTRNPQPEDRPEPVAHASPAGSTPASPRRRRVAAPDQKTPGVCGR